jgi:sugar diacid utilization regulator
METLCQALSLLPKQTEIQPPRNIRRVLSINELLAENRTADISDWIEEHTINTRRRFCVLNAKRQDKRTDDTVIPPFVGNYIEANMPNSLVLSLEKEISFLFFNLPESSRAAAGTVRSIEKACSYLTRQGFICGLSWIFDDIWDTKFAKEQASQAISAGSALDPDKKVFLFSDYVNYCIGRRLCGAADYKIFAHPALRILQEYDETHDSDYRKTLVEYVKEFKDISKTAKNLHVHKNSLRYRLGKIQELCGLDLDNPRDCFHVLMSFYMRG